MSGRPRIALPCLLAGLLAVGASLRPAPALGEKPIPQQLQGIEIKERLGAQAPLDLPFVDHTGAAVRLRDYMKPGRPVLLVLNYYACPTLCSIVLNGVLDGVRQVGFTIGQEFQMVTVSIDPKEGPALAAAKRASYLQALAQGTAGPGPGGEPQAGHGGPGPGLAGEATQGPMPGKQVGEHDWPFLTGQDANVRALAEAVGFGYRYDEASRQYAHAAGIFILTPEGRLSRVLYGIEFPRRDLRLALVEASRGGISAPVERLLLFCFHYDPQVRKYGLTPMGVMRIGGALTLVGLCTLLLVLWRRERRTTVVHD
jgi:protein SCO1/2